jgi:PKD repeat protein
MANLQVVLQDFAIVDVAHEFFMISNGVGELSRAHIRHNSNVSAELLHLEASHVATLGHSSTYNVTDAIRLKSPEAEASSIFRDTVIHTNTLEVSSGVVTRIGARVEVNADTVHLHGLECKLPNNAQINAPNKIGNCFSGEHPTARMTTSNLRGQGDLEVMFDVSRTESGPSDLDFATWQFAQNLPLVQATSPETSYHYTMPGVYRMEFIIWNEAGLRDSLRRRIDVDEVDHPLAPRVSYRYSIDPDDPNEVRFELLARPSFGAHIVAAKYIVDDDYEFVASGTAYKSATTHQFEQEKNYRVKVIAMDNFGRTASYKRTINLALSAHPPVIDVEIHQVAPRTLYVDLHRSFGVHSPLGGGRVVWGDGSRTDLSAPFASHTYSEPGVYELRVRLEDSDGRARAQVFLVDVTDDNGVTIHPTANFEVEELEFAQAFRLYVDQSGTPNGSIVSALWSFGDGTTGQGLEVVHYYEPGVYNVALQITDSAGMTDTQTQQIVVHGGSPLVAHLECYAQELTANCEWFALDSTKNISSVSIDWGNGNVQALPVTNSEFMIFEEITHSYVEHGAYTVVITVTNAQGNTHQGQAQVEFIQGPIEEENEGTLSAVAFCAEISFSEVQCQSFAFSQNGIITQYLWDMGDGTQLSGPDVIYDYGTGGSFTITHTVQNSLGQEESSSHSVNLQGASFPEVMIQCSNELAPRVLNCEAFGSDDIIEYRWSVENIVSYGILLNRQLDAGGLVDIELRVTNGAGLVTTIYETRFVYENTPPTASFSCESNEPWRLTCDGSASVESDFGDAIVDYRWVVGSEEHTGPFIDLLLTSGDYEVSLTVTDTFGEQGVLTRSYFVRDNTPPVAFGFCSSSAPLTFNCWVSYEFDADGDEIFISWLIGEEEIQGPSFSRSVQSKHQEVHLIATDSRGGSSSIMLVPEIIPGELEAKAFCSQIDAFLVECKGDQSFGTNETITNYAWSTNIGASDSGIVFQFEIDELGVLEVELTVTNVDGEEDSTIFTFETLPIEELSILSAGEIVLAGAANAPFYHLHEELTLSIVGEYISDHEDDFVHIYLNGIELSEEEYEIFEQSTIQLFTVQKDGLNILSFSSRDTERKVISGEFYFYAGQRDLAISIDDQADWMSEYDYLLVFATQSMEQEPTVINVINSSFVLKNTPEDISFVGLIPDTFLDAPPIDTRIVLASEQNIEFSLNQESLVPHSNLDFTSGHNDWRLSKGVKQITVRDEPEDVFMETLSDVETLSLSADEHGDLHVKSLLDLNANGGELNWSIELVPTSENDFFVTFQHNRTTGDISLLMVSKDDFVDEESGQLLRWALDNPKIEVLEDESNLVEVHFMAYNSPQGIVWSPPKKEWSLPFVSTASANQVATVPSLYVFHATLIDRSIWLAGYKLNSDVSDNDGASSEKGLRALTLGRFMRNPVNGNIILEGTGEFKGIAINRLRLELNTSQKLNLNNTYDIGKTLNLVICENAASSITHFSTLDNCNLSFKVQRSGDRSEFYIEIPEGRDVGEDVYRVYPVLTLVDTTDKVISWGFPRVHKDERANRGLRLFVLATQWTRLDRMYGYDSPRDFQRDRGGDKYIDKRILDAISELGDHNFLFQVDTNSTESLTLRANDFSSMNGGSRLGRPNRSTNHLQGIAADFRYVKLKEPSITEFIFGNKDGDFSPIVRAQTLNSILSILDTPISEIIRSKGVDYDEGIIVSYQRNSPFDRALSVACTAQGRLASSYIRSDYPGRSIHGDHFHVDFQIERKDYSSSRAFYQRYQDLQLTEIQDSSNKNEKRFSVTVGGIPLADILEDSLLTASVLVKQSITHGSGTNEFTESIFLPVADGNNFVRLEENILVVGRNLRGTYEEFSTHGYEVSLLLKFRIGAASMCSRTLQAYVSLDGLSQYFVDYNRAPASNGTQVLNLAANQVNQKFEDTFASITLENLGGKYVVIEFDPELGSAPDLINVCSYTSSYRYCEKRSYGNSHFLINEQEIAQGRVYLIYPNTGEVTSTSLLGIRNQSETSAAQYTVTVYDDDWGVDLIQVDSNITYSGHASYAEHDYCPLPPSSPYYLPNIYENDPDGRIFAYYYWQVESSAILTPRVVPVKGNTRYDYDEPVSRQANVTYHSGLGTYIGGYYERHLGVFEDIFDRKLSVNISIPLPVSYPSCSGTD